MIYKEIIMGREFDKILENYGIIKQTKRMLYPRDIQISEEFLSALKKEYYKLKIEEDVESPIKNRPQKFLKAMQFHIRDLENNAEQELDAMRRMMDEDTNPYVATTKGAIGGSESVDLAAAQRRREEVEDENIKGLSFDIK